MAANLLKRCNGNLQKVRELLQAKVNKYPACSPIPDSPSPTGGYTTVMSKAVRY